MKHIINDKALKATLVAFLNDPTNGFAKGPTGKPCGFTGKQKVELQMELLTELSVFRDDLSEGDVLTIIHVLQDTGNDSAARQAMEVAGVMDKLEGGKRGADATEMANKWKKRMSDEKTDASEAAE